MRDFRSDKMSQTHEQKLAEELFPLFPDHHGIENKIILAKRGAWLLGRASVREEVMRIVSMTSCDCFFNCEESCCRNKLLDALKPFAEGK
jgi:predicted class III extradiol MEMO1 family dioxygenase